MTPRPTISAVMIAKNEECDLKECLTSLSFCDEIVVVDGQSSDNTVSLARSMGAKVIETSVWKGFGPQKQLALEAATGDWIISIDADERVSERLRESILAAIAGNDDIAYVVNRENYLLSRRMRFGGWSPDRVLRLAKRHACFFTDDVVHESLCSDHPKMLLEGALLHFSYRSTEEMFQKHSHYASLGAQQLRNRRAGREPKNPLIAPLKAAWTFLRLYILRLGFLDGWRGLIFATAKSYETFWRYLLSGPRG